MSEDFDAYHRWLGIPPKHQPPDYYRLLGIERFEDDPEVIRDAANRQISHIRTYQLGPHADLSQQILNELGAAKACLLVNAQKAAYDRELRSRQVGLEPPSLKPPVLMASVEPASVIGPPAEPALPTIAPGVPRSGQPPNTAVAKAVQKSSRVFRIKAMQHIIAPILVLTLGYLILRLIGPQYDLPGLVPRKEVGPKVDRPAAEKPDDSFADKGMDGQNGIFHPNPVAVKADVATGKPQDRPAPPPAPEPPPTPQELLAAAIARGDAAEALELVETTSVAEDPFYAKLSTLKQLLGTATQAAAHKVMADHGAMLLKQAVDRGDDVLVQECATIACVSGQKSSDPAVVEKVAQVVLDLQQRAAAQWKIAEALEFTDQLARLKSQDLDEAKLICLTERWEAAEEEEHFTDIAEHGLPLARKAIEEGKNETARRYADLVLKAARRGDSQKSQRLVRETTLLILELE